jgi:predicted RNase H-like nuclease (RuvC/YqgF family)
MMVEESQNLGLNIEHNNEFVGIEVTAENFKKIDEAYGEMKAEQEESAESQDSKISSLEGRATNLESKMTAVEGRATSLESKMTAVESRATSLESKMTAVEGRATSLEIWKKETDTAITNQATTMIKLAGQISENEKNIDILADYVENSISAVEKSFSIASGTELNQSYTFTCCPGINRITVAWMGGVSVYIASSRSSSNCDFFSLNTAGSNAPTAEKVSYGNGRQLEIKINVTNSSSSARTVYLLIENLKSFEG